MTASVNVWIVVLNYNGLEDTRKCLRSLAAIDYPRLSTVVVDNASQVDPVPLLALEFPACHLIRNSANLGFAGGNNRGIEYALARGAEWVMLLNNDTVVSPEVLKSLTDAVRVQPRFGIAGPVINSMDEPDAVMNDGVLFNHRSFTGFFERKPIPLRCAQPPLLTEVDVVNGCCMTVSAAVFRTIGLIDEQFFLVHEESDFCLRAKEAGFACGVIGEVLVWHKGSSSFKRSGLPTQRYYDARNLYLLLTKHAGADSRQKSFSRSRLAYFKYVFYRYAIERENGQHEAAEAVIQGVCDAMARRYGQYLPQRHLVGVAIKILFEAVRYRPRIAVAWRQA